VHEFITTATPVASEDLARAPSLKVSPATIRNEMAELEGEGYIRRSHVSAGGIPSDKGYRYYVEGFEDSPELPLDLQRRIRSEFGQADRDVEAWIQTAAASLSNTVGNMAIVTFPRAAAARLKYIDLVYLQEFLALTIIVLQEARLIRHFLPLEEPVTQEELTRAANKLNDVLGGSRSAEIQAKELELTPLEELVRQETASTLQNIDREVSLEHCVDGLRLLLSQPEFAESSMAKQVVEIFEERVLLRSVLAEAPQEGTIGVFIGDENQEQALKPFSVVLSQYGIPQEVSGTIGVIGPTRLGYQNTIGGVRFLSSFMTELMMGVYGKP
jgi:heat-inducible transcriptional repressor